MITSKMTSINTTKMPAIYKKIPFHRLQTEVRNYLTLVVEDLKHRI